MTDLFREIDEEIRHDRALEIWKKYGNYVIAAASVLRAADAGVDIVDLALAAMSGSTSQPNLNSIVAALRNTPRDTQLDLEASFVEPEDIEDLTLGLSQQIWQKIMILDMTTGEPPVKKEVATPIPEGPGK